MVAIARLLTAILVKLLLVTSTSAHGQNNNTSGKCSPIINNNTGYIAFHCGKNPIDVRHLNSSLFSLGFSFERTYNNIPLNCNFLSVKIFSPETINHPPIMKSYINENLSYIDSHIGDLRSVIDHHRHRQFNDILGNILIFEYRSVHDYDNFDEYFSRSLMRAVQYIQDTYSRDASRAFLAGVYSASWLGNRAYIFSNGNLVNLQEYIDIEDPQFHEKLENKFDKYSPHMSQLDNFKSNCIQNIVTNSITNLKHMLSAIGYYNHGLDSGRLIKEANWISETIRFLNK